MKKGDLLKDLESIFTPYDPADYIETSEDVFMYIKIALEENDPEFLLRSLGHIARSNGMAQLAKVCGVTREGLYKTLSPKGNPSFKTVANVLDNMGFQITIKPKTPVKSAIKKRNAAKPKTPVKTKSVKKARRIIVDLPTV